MSNPFICQPMSADEYNQRLDAMIDQHCEDITDELYQEGYQQGRVEERKRANDELYTLLTRMKERANDCSNSPNAVDKGYCLAVMHLQIEIDKVLKEQNENSKS